MVLEDIISKSKRESIFHAALIMQGTVKIGNNRAHDKDTRKLLQFYQTFENMFNELVVKKQGAEQVLSFVQGLDKIIAAVRDYTTPFEVITINDARFPAKLSQYTDTSPVLYCQGDLSLLDKNAVAVIGTREFDPSILGECGEAIRRAVDKGFVVVSGLAKGCDTVGHELAIRYGGKTIAVVGNSLDKHYPKENQGLQDEIAKNHLLLSHLPIGIHKWSDCKQYERYGDLLIHRDYTVASLADYLLVLSTPNKGGTHHAIKSAIEQAKQILVMPNNYAKGYSWMRDYATHGLIGKNCTTVYGKITRFV